ncbi:TetR/AcrR family transcriptional regulator [Leptospira sp. GIMC2001]|uniref:TetR/AcrR family transcriptional regulator n=1 Tax=Leptospira sp. GIMC2001 TaxID=1513297 RepID=UPI00234A6147|nr:TetR/AcrR family transcriptional regulator [Leptospira sp. GIMC2001]WCL50142.1 TetR/AcrR family transcriptional regulator [Leptospira sp. GIMC2001]
MPTSKPASKKKTIAVKKAISIHKESLSSVRDRILEESLKIISENGAQALNMREVARRLKLSHAAPYRHFSSKEDVLAELGKLGFTMFAEHLERNLPIASSKENLMERFKIMRMNYADFVDKYPELYQIIFSTNLPDKNLYPELLVVARKSFEILLNQIAAMKAAGLIEEEDVILASFFVHMLVHGHMSLKKTGSIDKICEDLGYKVNLEEGASRLIFNALGMKNPSL